jgi:acyl carrier protein
MKLGTGAEPFLRELIARYAVPAAATVGLDDDLGRVAGLDSLSLLQIVAAIEEAYGVRVPDDEMSRLRTLRDLLAQVKGGK